ncbi:hypothetical protein FPE01S_04_04820 [Flavihumibacter petaseus NBRC 106054]|uniref:Uncharacterized protein n=2 Tax=Flavihumibacter TaxID=1004301 RepID=A0A0E9N606_9BACT|nr:hypothetical protein FPE01S_04_04820 [Flavihumibacter petaseus NBRC 106054]
MTSLISGFSGRVGDVLLKNYGDKIVLSAIPKMTNRVLSAKQRERNELMQEAILFAQGAIADPLRKMQLALKFGIPAGKVYRKIISTYLLCKGDDEVMNNLVEV